MVATCFGPARTVVLWTVVVLLTTRTCSAPNTLNDSIEEHKDLTTTERRVEEIYYKLEIDVDTRTSRGRLPSLEKIRSASDLYSDDRLRRKLDKIRLSQGNRKGLFSSPVKSSIK